MLEVLEHLSYIMMVGDLGLCTVKNCFGIMPAAVLIFLNCDVRLVLTAWPDGCFLIFGL